MRDTEFLATMPMPPELRDAHRASSNDARLRVSEPEDRSDADSPLKLPSERRLILTGMAVIVGLVAVLGAWGCSAPLHGAVIVQGYASVANERQQVQHLEGGIVKEILVQPGSMVKAGQPLIRLQEVQTDSIATSIQSQLDADVARVARLQAERTIEKNFVLPPDLAERQSEPGVAAILTTETMLMQTRRKALRDQVSLLRRDNDNIRSEIRSLENQVRLADTGIHYAREQLQLNETLRGENFVAPAKVLDYRSQVSDRQQRRAEAEAQVSQARQKIAQNDLKIEALKQTFMKDAADELRQAERRVDELRERLRPSVDALERSTIVAPIDGEVFDLKVHTVGGVIAPREPLLEIVPVGAPTLIKAKARPEDILHLHVGSEVDVQLVAYKRKTTPVVRGRLSYVAADMLVDNTPQGGVPYYEVRIEVGKEALAQAGDLHILPGMPVEAFIQTEARTVFEYLVQPLVQSMRKAGRES